MSKALALTSISTTMESSVATSLRERDRGVHLACVRAV
jgi:hypothetical protein